jgi:hypothetical protein
MTATTTTTAIPFEKEEFVVVVVKIHVSTFVNPFVAIFACISEIPGGR